MRTKIGNLPDFLIVGAPKGGTTSLHYYLKQHPSVFMPERKEPWFFSFMDNPPAYVSPSTLPGVVHDPAEYPLLFEGAEDGQMVGEASPSYLYTHDVAIANMRKVYGDDFEKLKIVITLRDPAARAWSQYWTFRRVLHEPATFSEAVGSEFIRDRMAKDWNIFYDYVGFGNYYNQVKAYLDAFGSDRVKILLFDDLKADAPALCRDLFEFIGVDPVFRTNTDEIYNVSGQPKSELLYRILLAPSILKRLMKPFIPYQLKKKIQFFIAKKTLKRVGMAPAMRSRLVDGYRDDIGRLSDLIGRDLSEWLR
jgi:hypothetical protein